MDCQHTQISEICTKVQIELAQLSTVQSVNMDGIILLQHVASADDVHKVFSA